ncbi:hypothetical protein AVEN_194557-1 [Araneus ventricosus]|uniref:Tc1-like transposase DDE domain-containing protein n=1 Tax=Araneus ventricosus TaxID=182803 RepID=A0A4Y2A7R0_ARAVE|nr:hypothetical protein AVEN_194557-1 [Araneus ventricosus]
MIMHDLTELWLLRTILRVTVWSEWHVQLNLQTSTESDRNLQNPIEHLWDYLGRQVAALSPPPRSLDELEQGLLRVWSSLPISVSDSLIDSMESRCRQCVQVRGGHIPY